MRPGPDAWERGRLVPFAESVCLYRQQCVSHPVYNTAQYVLQPGKAQKLEQALLLYGFPAKETDTTKTQMFNKNNKNIKLQERLFETKRGRYSLQKSKPVQ